MINWSQVCRDAAWLVFLLLCDTKNIEHALSYLWFGDKGTSRDGETVAHRAEILGHDGQTTPLFAACAGCQPLEGKLKKYQNYYLRVFLLETSNINKVCFEWSWLAFCSWHLDNTAAPRHWSWELREEVALTHLCHLFLERECELGASVHEGSCSVGYVLKPLNNEGGCNAKREIPNDVKVGWICGAKHIFTSIAVEITRIHVDHSNRLYRSTFSPSSHGLEILTGSPLSIL